MKNMVSAAAVLTSIVMLAACGGGGGGTANTSTAATVTSNGTTTSDPSSGGTTTTTPGGSTASSHAYVLQAATNIAGTTADTYYYGSTISRCDVETGGGLSGCVAMNIPALAHPLALAFSGANAYILNQTAYDPAGKGDNLFRILKCAVATDGSISNCADTFPGQSPENEYAFKMLANPNAGYVLKEGQLLTCPSDFSSKCGTDPNSASFPSTALAADVIFANNRLYVLNSGKTGAPASVLSFDVDPATGIRSAAATTVTDASFNTAISWSPTTSDTPIEIAINGINAYILTRYGNDVVQCAYDSVANTMKSCTSTRPLAALTGITPRNLAIQGSHAYVTDASRTASENSIVKCDIGATDGKLANCAVVPGLSFSTEIVDLVIH
jgi:hypothetical protein